VGREICGRGNDESGKAGKASVEMLLPPNESGVYRQHLVRPWNPCIYGLGSWILWLPYKFLNVEWFYGCSTLSLRPKNKPGDCSKYWVGYKGSELIEMIYEGIQPDRVKTRSFRGANSSY
jgi:hypothetical protein